MATIEIEGDELTVRMHGWDRLLAFKSSLTVPLKDISNVTVRPKDAHGNGDIFAVKVAGGHLPGVLQTGYFWITRGLTGGTKEVVDSLDAAETALNRWKHGGSGARARALKHVQDAAKEVHDAIGREELPTDEDRGWGFYDVHDADKTIGFDVENHRVRRVVVEVEGETPESAAERLQAALAGIKTYRDPAVG